MQWWHRHEFLTAVLVITELYVGRAVWARRWTLRPTSDRAKLTERTITAALILMGVGIYLLSPAGSITAGVLLHAVFGQWNLDSWVGDCLSISAAALFLLNVESRLELSTDQLRERFKRRFGLPMTVAAPALLACLVESPNAGRYWPDLFEAPTDHWLDLYWSICCVFAAGMVACAALPLLDLRREARNRITASWYLVAVAGTIAGCGFRIVTTWADIDNFARWFWLSCCLVPNALAYASSRSWRLKVQWLGDLAHL